MSTTSPRPRERSVLGDSWVVASSRSPQQGNQGNQAHHDPFLDAQTPTRKPPKRRKSNDASDSSMSGPELIMPSIYEAPISEASWIAPAIRSNPPQQSSPSLKRRHKPGAGQDSSRPRKPAVDSKVPKERTRKSQASASISLSRTLGKSIRVVINLLLFAVIAHLLVLPEIIQQYQTLCSIQALSAVYPASCIPPFPLPYRAIHHKPRPRSGYETVTSSQTRLESLLNATLHELTPLTSTLKRSESHLHTLQSDLKKVYPGPKHELDLEFNGCWQAIRATAKKFESLRADIRSAVDNLVVTADGSVEHAVRSVANDARLSTQIFRREQYLEQLTARMQSKADELAADLATLDDHLDSIATVLDREAKHISGFSWPGTSSPVQQAHNHNKLWSLMDKFRAAKVPKRGSPPLDESTAAKALPLLKAFRDIAGLHRPVSHAVQTLSNGLQSLQKKKEK
ncbi:hypothetical protein FE257_012225 [Aspergillus nanangensis]|uniref:Uncharacterized protein n=1 Tax=Aspergillus nanangensis TaxID=2582783 RepID=A0AAD4CG94_ASPNN|nr:hypothetical protein FE257_012225 [Aspergillus nanangensis]